MLRAQRAEARNWISQSDLGKARQLADSTISRLAKLLAERPEKELEIKNEISDSYTVLAALERRQGDLREMLSKSKEGLRVRQEIETQLRLSGDYKHLQGFAASHQTVGAAHFMLGDYQNTRVAFSKVLEIYQELSRRFPEDRNYRFEVARAYSNMALISYNSGDFAEAIETLTTARDLMQELVNEFPVSTGYQFQLATILQSLGDSYSQTNQASESIQSYKRSIDIRSRLADRFPKITEYRENLARCYYNLYLVLYNNSQYAECREPLQNAIKVYQTVLDDNPNDLSLLAEFCNARSGLADLAWLELDLTTSEKIYAETNRQLAELLQRGGESLTLKSIAIFSHLSLASLQRCMDEPGLAIKTIAEAQQLIDDVRTISPEYRDLDSWVVRANKHHAMALMELEDYSSAVRHFELAMAKAEGSERASLELMRDLVLFQGVEFDSAVEQIETVVQQHPDRAEVKLSAAAFYAHLATVIANNESLSQTLEESKSRFIDRSLSLLTEIAGDEYFKAPWNNHQVNSLPCFQVLHAEEKFRSIESQIDPRSSK